MRIWNEFFFHFFSTSQNNSFFSTITHYTREFHPSVDVRILYLWAVRMKVTVFWTAGKKQILFSTTYALLKKSVSEVCARPKSPASFPWCMIYCCTKNKMWKKNVSAGQNNIEKFVTHSRSRQTVLRQSEDFEFFFRISKNCPFSISIFIKISISKRVDPKNLEKFTKMFQSQDNNIRKSLSKSEMVRSGGLPNWRGQPYIQTN